MLSSWFNYLISGLGYEQDRAASKDLEFTFLQILYEAASSTTMPPGHMPFKPDFDREDHYYGGDKDDPVQDLYAPNYNVTNSV